MMPAHSHSGFASRSTLLVIAAAFAAGLGLWSAQRWFAPAAPAALPPLKAVRLIEPPREVAPWRLVQPDGSPATPALVAGHWTIVFLGFTHCPDVCPTTLAELGRAQKAWASIPEARRPRVLFVSVDPDRDTPKLAGEYARFFHPDTLAATGATSALTPFTESLGLVYMKMPGAGDDYSMDHSATLVLLDPQGRQAGLIRPPLDPAAIAEDLAILSERRP
jgi:protein SCO1/2